VFARASDKIIAAGASVLASLPCLRITPSNFTIEYVIVLAIMIGASIAVTVAGPHKT
jgi:hypothetical protein